MFVGRLVESLNGNMVDDSFNRGVGDVYLSEAFVRVLSAELAPRKDLFEYFVDGAAGFHVVCGADYSL